MTPDRNMITSRRSWDGLIKAWKLGVHQFVQNSPKYPNLSKTNRVVEIRNLVQPFTKFELINFLKQTGNFDEILDFWIDKNKSRALVRYDRPEEAEKTVFALHGFKWPSSNKNKLILKFSSEDIFDRHIVDAFVNATKKLNLFDK